MWHGQTCYISQIKTKRVGAWPLWIFSMVAQIFNVFKFIFAKSSRRKIFFCWGHTNTLGTFLRRSPPQWLMSSSPELHRSPRLADIQAARVYRPEEHLSPKADCHNWSLTTSLTSGEAMNSTLAMIIWGRLDFKVVSNSSGLTWCPARALMPYLLQSFMSCWAMVVKGQMTTIVEPVKVKFKYSKQVQVLKFCTRRKEKRGHQHGQGLPIAGWQGSQQVVPCFAIGHSTDQVDLLKKNSPSKFLLFIWKTTWKSRRLGGRAGWCTLSLS